MLVSCNFQSAPRQTKIGRRCLLARPGYIQMCWLSAPRSRPEWDGVVRRELFHVPFQMRLPHGNSRRARKPTETRQSFAYSRNLMKYKSAYLANEGTHELAPRRPRYIM